MQHQLHSKEMSSKNVRHVQIEIVWCESYDSADVLLTSSLPLWTFTNIIGWVKNKEQKSLKNHRYCLLYLKMGVTLVFIVYLRP